MLGVRRLQKEGGSVYGAQRENEVLGLDPNRLALLMDPPLRIPVAAIRIRPSTEVSSRVNERIGQEIGLTIRERRSERPHLRIALRVDLAGVAVTGGAENAGRRPRRSRLRPAIRPVRQPTSQPFLPALRMSQALMPRKAASWSLRPLDRGRGVDYGAGGAAFSAPPVTLPLKNRREVMRRCGRSDRRSEW